MAELTEATKQTIREAVTRGGPFLDQHHQGWRERVDFPTVRMDNGDICMLAQASGKNYSQAADDLALSLSRRHKLGFNAPPRTSTETASYSERCAFLTEEWGRQYFS